MLRIAVTGGLCSGKSLASGFLRESGYPVVDADVLAHALLRDLAPDLAARFGAHVLNAGEVDRSRLAGLVFALPGADPATVAAATTRRRTLHALLHPRILAAATQQLDQWESAGMVAAGVEAALLIEEGLLAGFDRILLVVAPVELRLKRYLDRGGSRDQGLARLAAQWSDAEKIPYADRVVVNDDRPEAVRTQVTAAMAEWIGKVHR